MPVGVCYISFRIHGAASLKDKRRVVTSIKDRIRSTFNVSVAETGSLDDHRCAELGCACISNDRAYLDGLMAGVIRRVEADGRIDVTDISTEIL